MTTKTVSKMQDSVERALTRAKIPHRFGSIPGAVSNGGERLFGLDITNRGRKNETLLLQLGDDTTVRVLSVSEKLGQVLLRVREPLRGFESYWGIEPTLTAAKKRVQFLKEQAGVVSTRYEPSAGVYDIYQTRGTPAETRFLLVGYDESCLFIAQVPSRPQTVQAAHAALVPIGVRGKRNVVRSGEFFFAPVSQALSKQLFNRLLGYEYNYDGDRISFFGEGLDRWNDTDGENVGTEHRPSITVKYRGNQYAIGAVVAPRHNPVALDTWHRVYQNREVPLPSSIPFVD